MYGAMAITRTRIVSGSVHVRASCWSVCVGEVGMVWGWVRFVIGCVRGAVGVGILVCWCRCKYVLVWASVYIGVDEDARVEKT